MGSARKTLIIGVATALSCSTMALAQVSPIAPRKTKTDIQTTLLSAIGFDGPKYSPIRSETQLKGLPIKILYDGPSLEGDVILEITISKLTSSNSENRPKPVSKTTLYLSNFKTEIDVLLNLPEALNGLQLDASIRDTNQNLLLESPYPVPLLNDELRIVRMSSSIPPETTVKSFPDFTDVETISGRVTLPLNSYLPPNAQLHVQLLENALAGGVSMELIAEESGPARLIDGTINFKLQRGLWDRADTPDMYLKAWITDNAGRTIFVMNTPTGYNGPDIDYNIQLEGLRQGKNTKRGANLSVELMAQTLVQGEASFDPVIGIPGQARLNIKLKQDRGDFNRNPVLTEQTLILRGLETRIPFALTTDSTHFDPFAPAPFLSVSLTDVNGRVFYESGEIRARGDKNIIRLYPR